MEDTVLSNVLTNVDRCDSCGAQAYVSAKLSVGAALLFCKHHFESAEPKLSLLNAEIIDERHKLTPKPRTISSNENAF